MNGPAQTHGAPRLRGVYTIMPTPFDDNGRVDEASLETLTNFLIDRGVDGLTVLGVLGEAPKLSEQEQEGVVRVVTRAADGRVPVYAGASAGGVGLGVRKGMRFLELGASGLMVAPVAPDSRAIFAQYSALDKAITEAHDRCPVIVHDYPAVTGVRLNPELVTRLAAEIGSVSTIKLEDPPTGPKITAIRELGSQISILGGLGGQYLVEELERGANGVMTGLSFPELLVRITRAYETGDPDDFAAARSEFFAAAALLRYEFQPGIGLAIRKEIYRRRGAIARAVIREPGSQIDDRLMAELDQVLAHVDLELRPV